MHKYKIKVLVIDDSALIRGVMKEIINREREFRRRGGRFITPHLEEY